ncbi:MAG TPA: 2-dehydro-3-deoxygalactonokinase [Paucimonas sp.]|nr:2-dehydro-3-deoxygalactonokinase [Paucimonas sp.]
MLTESRQQTVLGIDWGTTNRRVYLLDADGRLERRIEDGEGILKVGPDGCAASLLDLLQALELGEADVIMSGMVGSRNGWRQVPYLDKEQPLLRLSEALVEIEAPRAGVRCRIVPGYCAVDACGTPDVMRGEETQILGTLASGAGGGWFLLPGTHSKWVFVEDGRVREIITFMTGELFSLLSTQGTLAALVREKEHVPEAFDAGLKVAQRSGFTHAAFGCRALVVTDTMPEAQASSYLSGLLIGAEFAGVRQKAGADPRGPVHIVGSPQLTARYVEALQFFDIQSRVWQPDEVYVAALRRLAAIQT